MDDEEERAQKRLTEKAVEELENLMQLLAVMAGPLPPDLKQNVERYMFWFFELGQQSLRHVLEDQRQTIARLETDNRRLKDKCDALRHELRKKTNGANRG